VSVRHAGVAAIWLALAALLPGILPVVGACDDSKPRRAWKDPASMKEKPPLPMDLFDIVQRYYYAPLTRDMWLEEDIFKRLEATPEYQAWDARRREAWNDRERWAALVDALRPGLPNFEVYDVSVPAMLSYEAEVWVKPVPEPGHGVVFTKLVVRVSYLAPLYEIYQSSSEMYFSPNERPREDGSPWPLSRNHHRTHDDIDPAFQPAVEAFSRAIEERYGYWPADPKVLDMKLINTAIWEESANHGTLREALFSMYRL
jgi:hypothetical protein